MYKIQIFLCFSTFFDVLARNHLSRMAYMHACIQFQNRFATFTHMHLQYKKGTDKMSASCTHNGGGGSFQVRQM